ncbi:MAG: acetate--CoA ligase [Planctomycetota bacterium]
MSGSAESGAGGSASGAAGSIESVLHETRRFEPPAPGAVGAPKWHVTGRAEYDAMHKQSVEHPEDFWGGVASELHWFEPWSKVVDYKAPDAQWFVGGKTNLCYNCVDRQVDAGHGDEPAIIWEGEPMMNTGKPEIRVMTYRDLQHETAKFGNVLKKMGVKKGDVVTIYMGMVPELAVAMLACMRIGAAHSVIFGGFSAQAIADRVADADSRVIVTCDGSWRRGKVVPLKENVDAAINELGEKGPVERVIYLKRTRNQIVWHEGRDYSWRDLMFMADDHCPCEPMDSEDPSFILYTSGSTGKPKGIQHTTGGYMVYTYLTSKYTFNLFPDQAEPKRSYTLADGSARGVNGQVYWCTADCGWITGHSYIVYGVLPNRVPTVMYEGAPNFPDEARFWAMVERHRVTQFYTAPTAIRAFMKWGDEHPKKHDLTSLQVLGTVGEPINPEAWMWYHTLIGREKCPIVDTYWQTETGGHIITPLPGVTATKPGSCTLPFFGIDAAVVGEDGVERGPNEGGLFVIRKPWPAMLRGVYGDRQRFIETYWSTVKIDGEPVYTAGDGARRDDDGYVWVMGRIDDVINVSGHRLGTMEVESALVSHDSVVEAAVVGVPHEIKGTGIAAFITLEPSAKPGDDLKSRLSAHVAKEIGAIAKPDQIRFTDALPKTRSGKIMRRLLRDIAAGVEHVKQDTSTLEDFAVLAKLREGSES